MKVSVNKEKAIVFATALGTAVTGYLAGIGLVLESATVGSVSAAVIAFWSQGINTPKDTAPEVVS